MKEEVYVEEDEIDLRELFKTILDKKKFILIFTFVITLITIIYVLFKTPIYQVSSVVRIGYIGDNLLEKSNILEKKLRIVFHVDNKQLQDNVFVTDIKSVKKVDEFLTINTQANNNEKAIEKNNEVLGFLQNEYQSKIDEYVFDTKLKIKNLKVTLGKVDTVEKLNLLNTISIVENQEITRINKSIEILVTQKIPNIKKQIDFVKNVELKSINNKLLFDNKKISEYEKNINKISSNESNNDTQNLIYATQILNNQNFILNLQNRIEDLNKQKISLLNIKIPELELKVLNLTDINLGDLNLQKRNLKNGKLKNLYFERDVLLEEKKESIKELIRKKELSLSKDYISNSKIVGSMVVNDNPIKPKKKLIVIVSFVTALILSIFIVFFIQFIKSFKEEDK